MSSYTELISQFLQKQYPDHNTEMLVISTLNFKIIPFKAQSLLEKYARVKVIVLTRCDLRNLQNFPHLPLLSDLDLSYNSLQGTLNFLMPCSQLKYLDLSNNLISSYSKLQPLRRLAGIEVCVKDNPFTTKQVSWKNKIKHYSIKLVKQQRKLIHSSTPQQAKQEDIRAKRQEDNNFIIDNFSPINGNPNDIRRQMTTMRRILNQDNQRMEAQRRRQNLLDDSDSDDEKREQFQHDQDKSQILQDGFANMGNIDILDDSDNEENSEAGINQPEEGDQLFIFNNPAPLPLPDEQAHGQNQSSDSSS